MNGEVSTSNAKLVYILYLVGIILGVTGIVGVIMAYVNRGDGPDWMDTHYQFQIRTFWIGLLYMILGTVLAFVVVGYFIWLFWLIWIIVRCAKGLKQLEKGEAVNNPTSWMFG
jgi:uncharacterized membrane protein